MNDKKYSMKQFISATLFIVWCLGVSSSTTCAEDELFFRVEGFGVEFSADKEGNIIYTSVKGMAGIGSTEEEAKANLSPIEIGKDPSGRSILYFHQKTPYKGLRTFYLDATSGLRFDAVMEPLFELSEVESQLISGKKAAVIKLNRFLTHKSALVRQAAVETIARVGERHALKQLKAALAEEKNSQLKQLMQETVRKLEKE